MLNKGNAVSFYFELSFKGEDVDFQEVIGISKELKIEEVVPGGENRNKYRLPTLPHSQNLVLRRALVPEGSLLIDWCSSCIDDGLTNITTQEISVSLLDPSGIAYIKWTFHNAYPVKYSIADLKSQENGILIESVELAYTYVEVSPTSIFENLFD